MVLGMTRTEIDRAFDGIVEMAELERFIDTPEKFYSSGMQVRLGFASAVASAPDVMLVDEVLSVGDIAFQAKSFAKMSELREQGSTLLVVSHNLDAIRRTCDRVVVLNGGATVFAGPTNEAITVYHTLLRDEPEYADQSAPAVIHDFRLIGPDSQPTATVHSGDEVTFQMHVRFAQRVVDPALGFWVSAEAGQMVYADNTITTPTGTFEAGESMVCEVRVRLALTTGVYFSGGGLRWGRERFEQVSAPRLSFSIIGRDRVLGVADLGAEFSVSPSDGVVRSEVAE
jgi:ABC-type microcin C transport system duplicated ATPase subunit YejF